MVAGAPSVAADRSDPADGLAHRERRPDAIGQ